jgi:hypothetical protein
VFWEEILKAVPGTVLAVTVRSAGANSQDRTVRIPEIASAQKEFRAAFRQNPAFIRNRGLKKFISISRKIKTSGPAESNIKTVEDSCSVVCAGGKLIGTDRFRVTMRLQLRAELLSDSGERNIPLEGLRTRDTLGCDQKRERIHPEERSDARDSQRSESGRVSA